jgi:Ca-activated chloride channel family protein
MKWKLIALSWLFCGWIAAAPGLAQEPKPQPETISIKTALVTLNVSVTDKQGRELDQLTQENFAIYEDGQLQDIDFFGAADQPISFGLLIDRSQSMGDTGKLANAKAVLQAFLRAGNPQNEAFCLAFSETSGFVTDFTSDYTPLSAQLDRLWAEGGTALYDAIKVGLERLQQGKHPRRALLIVTDGGDQHSQIALADLLKHVQQSHAQIYTIGFFSPYEAVLFRQAGAKIELTNNQRMDNPRVVFNTLARETGAETYFPRSAKELAQTLEAIARSLRRQYVLTYYPKAADQADRYRRITVKLQHTAGRQWQIRTRQGYRLSEPASEAPPPPKAHQSPHEF